MKKVGVARWERWESSEVERWENGEAERWEVPGFIQDEYKITRVQVSREQRGGMAS